MQHRALLLCGRAQQPSKAPLPLPFRPLALPLRPQPLKCPSALRPTFSLRLIIFRHRGFKPSTFPRANTIILQHLLRVWAPTPTWNSLASTLRSPMG